jgi:dTDP-4-dehydrorhamnose reductase
VIKLLLIGGAGQLGLEIQRQAASAGFDLFAPDRDQLDLGKADAIRAVVERDQWDCVINSAAFTAVDAAEEQPGAAFLANCQGPAWLAEATASRDIPLIHVSTDYVFGGDSPQPYAEADPVDPIGVYGASKAAGELAVRTANSRSVIVRTAWVLSAHRSNFLKTMLRLAGERDWVGVVADQRGCPTSAADIAAALLVIARRLVEDASSPTGIFHFVNAGEASWHELASEIFRLSAERGGPTAEVRPIRTTDFPTRARRPSNSRLSTDKIEQGFGLRPRPWRQAVAEIISDLDEVGALKEKVR